MKDWLKYTFLSFFSYKRADESKKRSFFSSFLCFAIAIICFMFCFYFGYQASFSSYYRKSTTYQNFLYSAFTGENSLQIKLENGIFYSSKTSDFKKELTVSASDTTYDKDGYELVIDTRDSKINYNDFTLSYFKGKGEEKTTITYEEYLKLDSTVQANYSMEVTYSSHSLELTDEKIQSYLDYLLTSKDQTVLSETKKLLVDDKVPTENYNSIYELYCKAYYPSFSSVEKYGSVPMMRTYYINNYLGTDTNGKRKSSKFLVILDDSLFTYFLDEKGNSHNIAGYMKDQSFLLLNQASNLEEGKKNVDSFIHLAFKTNKNITLFNYLVYTVRMAIFLIIGWLIMGIIFSIIGTILKDSFLRNYFRMLNLSSLFFLFSGIVASILAFALSFILPTGIIYYFSISFILATIFTRTMLQIIHIHHQSSEQDNIPQTDTGEHL